MSSYWRSVAHALPGNCSADWAAVTRYYDTIVSGADIQHKGKVKHKLAAALKLALNPSETGNGDNAEIGNSLITPLHDFQNVGVAGSVQLFCDALETAGGDLKPTIGGLQASHAPVATIFEVFVAAVAKLQTHRASTVAPEGQMFASDDTTDADAQSWY
jgi:hypothetical protein